VGATPHSAERCDVVHEGLPAFESVNTSEKELSIGKRKIGLPQRELQVLA
jgi:hypothetical protein